MKAIILSAGQGRRLLPITADHPKCAVPVAGAPILAWQLREISRCPEIDEVVVITGYATDKAEGIISSFPASTLKIRSRYNPFFAYSDNLATCWIARHEMDRPFLLINGDTLFRAEIVQRLLQADAQTPITLTVSRKASYDDDDMKVILENGRLRQVGKKLDKSQVNGESIGMTRFDCHGATLFTTELERSMRLQEGLQRWYLSAINAVAQKHTVGACLVDGMNWCEIDTMEDIEHADCLLNRWTSSESTPLQESAQ